MKKFFKKIRRFYASMGLVEQSQVVASTAVVVAMVTIISAHFFTGQPLQWLDFISLITVGVIGYFSVFFSLKYGRQLEEQRRQLVALNTIAEAVNHSVELNYVLQSSLIKVMELLGADSGWIYLVESRHLVLKHHYGTTVKFFPADASIDDDALSWIQETKLFKTNDSKILNYTTVEFQNEGMEILASIPFLRADVVVGVLIIASKKIKTFEAKKITLLQAFGNQISVALHNASLFEQVKQSEQLYADLYENSPDMYHSVDSNGNIVSCNLTETQMLGVPKEEIIGRPLLRLYPPSQHKMVMSNLKKIFNDGQELKGIEERIKKTDGTLIDVSTSTSIVYNAEGKPTLARIVLRDITEKKKMEAKILEAQKIDSIGNLAGGVAHDFNNILTSILGSASIMRRKLQDDHKWMKYVDLIETASRRGASLTRQLLTFARKSNPHIKLVDTNTIIGETIKLFSTTTSKSIHIKSILSEEPVLVEADEGQLQQALLNLCLNSRDAMPNGGVLVIQCKPTLIEERQAIQYTESKPGDYVMISITDSGVGIPQNILNRIFEPFFTTKEQGKGTGLGLSVVYGIVRSHNGYIHVDSEINSGSVFTIYLPRIKKKDSITVTEPATKQIVGGTERILLIEDEISVGQIGYDILKDLGYSVEVVHTGWEALQKLSDAKPPFELVILDMNMPRMGGRVTFEQIRKQFPSLKVLICSGYSDAMLDEGEFFQLIDGYIQKPYEISDFSQKIRAIFDNRKENNIQLS